MTTDATEFPDFSHVVGHRFPGGTYRLPGYEAWLWADAVQAVPDPDFAHPEIAYMVGLQGGGASIADIMELLGADQDSGVMFGSLDFDFAQPIRPETTYQVTGHVAAVERKVGRKAGVFDRATFVHELTVDGESEVAATITHTWIFPRELGS